MGYLQMVYESLSTDKLGEMQLNAIPQTLAFLLFSL